MPYFFQSFMAPAPLTAGGTIAGNLTVTGTLGVTGATTLTGDIAAGNINMASSKVVTLAAGTLAAPSLRFAGSNSGTGYSAETADQIIVGRQGVQLFTHGASNNIANMYLQTLGSIDIKAAIRCDAEAIKTDNYTITASDTIVIMNGVGKTATLPTTPSGDQLIWVKNLDSGDLTVARNGQTIDGAAADLTLAGGAQATLYFEPSGWIRLGA